MKGRPILLQGDCLERLHEIKPASVDLVLTDLPSGLTDAPFDKPVDLARFWAEISRVTKPSAAVLVFTVQPYSSAVVMSNSADYRYEWIWEKSQATGFLNAKHQPLRAHEHILVFGKKLPKFYPVKGEGRPYRVKQKSTGANYETDSRVIESVSGGERYPRSILRYSKDTQRNKIHPQQKPVRLLEYLIRSYTLKGQTVLDPFMGSGSTGVAAMNWEREFVGMEKDATIAAAAKSRLAKRSRGGSV